MPKLTLLFKGQVISVHHLQDVTTRIGRGADCDIRIDSLAIAPVHAEVTMTADQCRIVSRDKSFPTYLNDTSVEDAPLTHGDQVQVGKHTLSFASDVVSPDLRAEDEPVPAAAPSKAAEEEASGKEPDAAYLQILSGEHFGRIIPLTRNMVRLGKSGGDCAIIVHRQGGYYLSYLEGSLPTVNGVPIGEETVLLTDRSTVQIGDTRLRFFE